MRTPLSLLVVGALLLPSGCRDPEAGPPPRHLSDAQRAQVAAHTLGEAPQPQRVPPGGPVTLGDRRVRYLGLDVAPVPASRGRDLVLTHYWEALAPLEHDWKVFVHLGPPRGRNALVTADHHPIDGLWPTSRWSVGTVYADRQRVPLPEDWPAAAVEVWVGLYRLDRRLDVDRRSAHDGGDRIRAGRVPVAGGALPVPEYEARRAATPPVIDGRLDDPAWAGAPEVGLVRSGDGGRPRAATRARMVWDERHLYVAFDVEDRDAWSTFEADDANLWEQEAVEVFVDADGNGRTYDEIQVAPSGRTFDARFQAPRRGMDRAWSSGVEAAVHVDGTLNDPSDRDRGWTAELALPFARLSAVPRVPPRPGEVWRVNLYRLEHHDRERVEGSAFSPPRVGDFHRPERFGVLRFVDPRAGTDAPAGRGRR